MSIPATVRNSVWIKYIGNERGTSKCFCCGYQDIDRGNYECGHIISRHSGGTCHIDNLRPICGLCNKSMGTLNMEEFMKTYGFIKPPYWKGMPPLPVNLIDFEEVPQSSLPVKIDLTRDDEDNLETKFEMSVNISETNNDNNDFKEKRFLPPNRTPKSTIPKPTTMNVLSNPIITHVPTVLPEEVSKGVLSKDISSYSYRYKVEKILSWAHLRPTFDPTLIISVQQQLQKGRSLSEKQEQAIDNIISRFHIKL